MVLEIYSRLSLNCGSQMWKGDRLCRILAMSSVLLWYLEVCFLFGGGTHCKLRLWGLLFRSLTTPNFNDASSIYERHSWIICDAGCELILGKYWTFSCKITDEKTLKLPWRLKFYCLGFKQSLKSHLIWNHIHCTAPNENISSRLKFIVFCEGHKF